jgi:hypothetical protein
MPFPDDQRVRLAILPEPDFRFQSAERCVTEVDVFGALPFLRERVSVNCLTLLRCELELALCCFFQVG